ncbi:hypothetical protein [Paenibacillus sp.]|uniref:hypothetical protein n=1 Tax=Paenibacillus sp. TaxID=58172 RepID=UPI002811C9BD|nr:hypothetical protein [Paenibacillus sp.]
MKKFLILTQIAYAIFLPFWFLIWGISFMGFDSGFNWLAVGIVTAIGLYPVAGLVCSILAWVLRTRKARAAVVVNLIPMLWLLGIGVPVLLINLFP